MQIQIKLPKHTLEHPLCMCVYICISISGMCASKWVLKDVGRSDTVVDGGGQAIELCGEVGRCHHHQVVLE